VDQFRFNDFEEYAHAIRDVDCRFALTGREAADWSIQLQAVGRLTLLIGQDGGPCIYEGANREGMFTHPSASGQSALFGCASCTASARRCAARTQIATRSPASLPSAASGT